MVGKYDIVLYNNKVHYHLNIKRNITVLRGDSASGKSELLRFAKNSATYLQKRIGSYLLKLIPKEYFLLMKGIHFYIQKNLRILLEMQIIIL